jgi:hypothetical protein
VGIWSFWVEQYDPTDNRLAPVLLGEWHRQLEAGAADQILASLGPSWDEHADAIGHARTLINAESSAEHILSSGQPAVIDDWQGLSAHIAVISKIGAIAAQFGPRTGNFPQITEYALGDGFRLEDRALLCTDGPIEADSAVYRQPDRGHRTSPWFRLPLKLHSIDSARDRYRDWASSEFDRLHSGPTESWVDEKGNAHQKPRPKNPYRAKESVR